MTAASRNNPAAPRIRFYHAATLDGYIADVHGGVGFLDAFNDVDYGFAAFKTEIGTSVVGRATYDQSLTFPKNSFPGARVIVLTSRELERIEPGVEVMSGDVATIAESLRSHSDGDIWIVGGATVMRAFLDAGEVDRIDHFVIPLLLGDGISAYFSSQTRLDLELIETQHYERGLVRLSYESVRW